MHIHTHRVFPPTTQVAQSRAFHRCQGWSHPYLLRLQGRSSNKLFHRKLQDQVLQIYSWLSGDINCIWICVSQVYREPTQTNREQNREPRTLNWNQEHWVGNQRKGIRNRGTLIAAPLIHPQTPRHGNHTQCKQIEKSLPLHIPVPVLKHNHGRWFGRFGPLVSDSGFSDTKCVIIAMSTKNRKVKSQQKNM